MKRKHLESNNDHISNEIVFTKHYMNEILLFVPTVELFSLFTVCKLWNELLHSNDFWKKKVLIQFPSFRIIPIKTFKEFNWKSWMKEKFETTREMWILSKSLPRFGEPETDFFTEKHTLTIKKLSEFNKHCDFTIDCNDTEIRNYLRFFLDGLIIINKFQEGPTRSIHRNSKTTFSIFDYEGNLKTFVLINSLGYNERIYDSKIRLAKNASDLEKFCFLSDSIPSLQEQKDFAKYIHYPLKSEYQIECLVNQIMKIDIH